ncbi:hypothetical protein LP420_32230 [Massilia sp. B-10]|nr:hypothetical protein LP420_32230 [Massilia sp. B-10]
MRLDEQEPVLMRVRQHRRFQAGENAARPDDPDRERHLALPGCAPTSRTASPTASTPTGLFFGERNAAHDHFCGAEIDAWKNAGALESLSLAFSRDGGEIRYVQHALAAHTNALREWIAQGAAIYVCGSLQGMASGVHDTLVAALGLEALDQLDAEGRYRHDVY